MSLNIKYGFGNAIKYNAPKLDVGSSTSTSTIISSRVRDIILDDTHDKFNDFGGWNGIGTIFIEPTRQPILNSEIPLIPAYPAFPNIKQYPLINELVPVIYLADPNVTENTSAVAAYYLPPINVWNSQVHNAVPSSDITPELEDKEYPLVEAGSVRRITDQDTSIELGDYFNENNVLNNYPLLPYEGDIIYEGRFSNSIRLGSTVDNDRVYSNLWSSGADKEDFGSPITILRNGQSDIGRNILDSTEPWIPTLENINTDKSSIYLTAGQQIPLVLASDTSDSYASNTNDIPTVQYYLGDQILLNSGQLVFNSKDDNIVLSSNKSIHLSANTTLNFDAVDQITLVAPKVYLGSSQGIEGIQLQSAVLGEELTQALLTFIQSIELAAEAMINNTAIIGPVATLTSTGPILKSACTNLKNTLNSKSILSNQVFVNKGTIR
jgi:hypothetical protein